MDAAIAILSFLLVAEFVFAPINLWTGRTIDNFTRFTGLEPSFATRILAPVKLAAAIAVALGFLVPALGIAGAAVMVAISAFYLVRLAAPGRRDPAGIAAFVIFGSLALALLVLRILHG